MTTLNMEYIAKRSAVDANGCMVWTGALNKSGLGKVTIDGKTFGSHIAAWIAANGNIPQENYAKHTCSNKSCVNPDHLKLTLVKCRNAKDPNYIKSMVNVDNTTGCWNWQGKLNHNGYARIANGNGSYLMHRIAYEVFVGPIAKGFAACHKCDNPSCVNPEHIFLGTQEDNMKDMAGKGRASKGEEHYGSKLTTQAVIEIRARAGRAVEIAKEYGVSRRLISKVKQRMGWCHVV